jgi:hypothetical protein
MGELPSIYMVDEYVEIMEAYNEYRSTKEGERMDELLIYIKHLAVDFCELHDVTCCTKVAINTLISNANIIVIL